MGPMMHPLLTQADIDKTIGILERWSIKLKDDELLSVGMFELVKCLEIWDPECGCSLSTLVYIRTRRKFFGDKKKERKRIKNLEMNYQASRNKRNIGIFDAQKAIDTIPDERMRGIARLYWVCGYTQQEVASIVKLSFNTVRLVLDSCVDYLKQTIKPEMREQYDLLNK